jgi:hypothetical protein
MWSIHLDTSSTHSINEVDSGGPFVLSRLGTLTEFRIRSFLSLMSGAAVMEGTFLVTESSSSVQDLERIEEQQQRVVVSGVSGNTVKRVGVKDEEDKTVWVWKI